MARKKTTEVRVDAKALLSRRLREIRQELFGEHGGPELARRLNLPARTWYNYETGVTVPAEVLLNIIERTGVNPLWLLSGEEPKYRRNEGESALTGLSPIELIRLGLERFEQEPRGVVGVLPENLPGGVKSDFIAVGLVPMKTLRQGPIDPSFVDGYVMASRQWVPNPNETVGATIEDDAMHPVLPPGSIVAVDRSVVDPLRLKGRIVAARPESEPVIRWLEVSGRHLILRPNSPDRGHPLLPVNIDSQPDGLIIGQVVWSWSRFG